MDFHKMKKMEKTVMKQLIAVIALSVCFGAFADSVANRPSDLADTFSLNADWRFTKAPETIPLAQAKASVETKGVKVEDPAFDDSAWESVSVPHPINARDSFDNHAVDAGESSFWRGMAFYRKRFTLLGGTGDGERGTWAHLGNKPQAQWGARDKCAVQSQGDGL